MNLTVRDSSGGAIPGASVRLTSDGTDAAFEGVTDAMGGYHIGSLPPGQYRIQATLDGFETVVKETAVAANQTAALELTLSPSRLTESVVVTARRVEEVAQEVPIPLSVVTGQLGVDGAFFARPAAATLDFTDVERIEVLRGPQGTLFGKNTSAGAINVTTRKPTSVARATSSSITAPSARCRQKDPYPDRCARTSPAACRFPAR